MTWRPPLKQCRSAAPMTDTIAALSFLRGGHGAVRYAASAVLHARAQVIQERLFDLVYTVGALCSGWSTAGAAAGVLHGHGRSDVLFKISLVHADEDDYVDATRESAGVLYSCGYSHALFMPAQVDDIIDGIAVDALAPARDKLPHGVRSLEAQPVPRALIPDLGLQVFSTAELPPVFTVGRAEGTLPPLVGGRPATLALGGAGERAGETAVGVGGGRPEGSDLQLCWMPCVSAAWRNGGCVGRCFQPRGHDDPHQCAICWQIYTDSDLDDVEAAGVLYGCDHGNALFMPIQVASTVSDSSVDVFRVPRHMPNELQDSADAIASASLVNTLSPDTRKESCGSGSSASMSMTVSSLDSLPQLVDERDPGRSVITQHGGSEHLALPSVPPSIGVVYSCAHEEAMVQGLLARAGSLLFPHRHRDVARRPRGASVPAALRSAATAALALLHGVFFQAKCVLHVVSRHFIGLLLANGHDRELVVAVLNNLDFTSVVSSDHLLAVAVQAVQLLHRELFAVVDAGISASIHAATLAAAWLRQCVGFWVLRASKVVPGGGLDRPVGTLLVPSGGSRFWV